MAAKKGPKKKRAFRKKLPVKKAPGVKKAVGPGLSRAYSPEEKEGRIAIIERCLQQGMGFIASCERAGIAASTVINWRKEDQSLHERLTIAGQVLIEQATAGLAAAVKKRSMRAIEFTLSRRSPDFMERKRVEVSTPEEHAEKVASALRAMDEFLPVPPDDDEIEAMKEALYE